jgi:hypothetical protein
MHLRACPLGLWRLDPAPLHPIAMQDDRVKVAQKFAQPEGRDPGIMSFGRHLREIGLSRGMRPGEPFCAGKFAV